MPLAVVTTSNTPIRVLIADKNPLIRAGLKQLMAEDTRFGRVDQCEDGEDFLAKSEPGQFDVGIIGWVLPKANGKYILDHLQRHDHALRIVVYTGAEGEAIAAQAMAHGAAAYVTKSEAPDVLLDTVASVAQGRMVFPYLDVRVLNANPLTALTRRELEVLSSLAAGKSNKEIAAEQQIAPNTVKFHLKNLYQKLDVHNRAQAVGVYLKS
jgi:two-component system nitrate/nitrite response regulator NarP